MTCLIRSLKLRAAGAAMGIALSFVPRPSNAQSPAPEMRAMWVSRFEWPSGNMATAKANIDSIMANIAANNFNTVLFQVRGQCDVHYPSPDEPWSNNYNWTDPGWDPLAYAIEAAHSRGLEFHAYINTHTLAAPVPPAVTVPPHPFNLHGPNAPGEQSWMIRDSGGNAGLVDSYFWISPAHTEASAWTRKQVLYVVKNYDVDGVHFDRIRSPGSIYTYDAATQRRWSSGQVSDSNPDALSLPDFMRSQITRDLRNIQGEIQYYKPWIKTSAAPFGIVKVDSTTHYQGTGTQSYHSWFQDSWGWLDAHVLDFMVPQIYWQVGSSHPFEALLADWQEHNGGRHVVAGSTTNGGSKTLSALLAEHAQTRLQSAAGHCVFSVSSMGNYWEGFKTGPYDQPTTVPEMPWKTQPTHGTITGYVVDPSGNPVVDAKINLAGDTRLNAAGTGPYNYLSAHDGFFSILDVVPGAAHQLTASHSVHGRGSLSPLSVSAGGVTSVTVVIRNSVGAVTLDRTVYRPGQSVQITLADADLAGAPNASVRVDSATEGGEETVVLSPQGSGGRFTGNITLQAAAGSPGDGILQVAHNDVVRVRYSDADTGDGTPATAQATASVDALGPVISGVAATGVGTRTATVVFNLNESGSAVVRYGLSCGALTQSVTSAAAVSHQVTLSGLTNATTYYFTVEATDAAGNTATSNNGGACHSFTTTDAADYFTELFSASDNDLTNKSILFRPNGSGNYYTACIENVTAFPTSPSGGTPLGLTDEGVKLVTLTGGRTVQLYGNSYSSFYASGNGFISFGSSSNTYTETTAFHFQSPRISVMFDDLDPGAAGATTLQELSDRVVVTYENVPEWTLTTSNSFQVEMFYDGRIRMTWLGLAIRDGLVGLSRGTGLPADFNESDLTAYEACPPPDPLTVSPTLTQTITGQAGGPFTPSCRTYMLENAGSTTLDWTSTASQLWLSISPSSGTLQPGSSAQVSVCVLAGETLSLPLGAYLGKVEFTNLGTNSTQERDLELRITPPPPQVTAPQTPLAFYVGPEATTSIALPLGNQSAVGADNLVFEAKGVSLFGKRLEESVATSTSLTTNRNRYRGNTYEVSRTTRLRQISSHLSFTTALQLHYVVYESTSTLSGPYRRIHSQFVTHQGTGAKFYASNALDLELAAGRFYIIAVGWPNTQVGYPFESGGLPRQVSFGVQRNGFGADSYPLGETAQYLNSQNSYPQVLTTFTPWISAVPRTGSVPPEESSLLQVQASAAGYASGSYPGTLEIWSNDPVTPVIQISATMHVLPLPSPIENPYPPNGSVLPPYEDFRLAWANGGNASSYDVYFGQTSPAPFVGNATQPRFPVDGIEPGKRYFWRVDARNQAGVASGDEMTFVLIGLPSAASDWALYP